MMSKIIVINKHNWDIIEKAIRLGAEILLMQDAVLFTNNKLIENQKLGESKIYAMKRDVERRGLRDRVLGNVELLDIDGVVDLLFSGKTVINM
jgi:sulfur relay protein TusB/DsrH